MAFPLITRRLLASSASPLARAFSLSSSLQAAPNATSTLFIGGLNFDSTPASLAERIREHTNVPVTSSRIVQDRMTGRSKGFGYVEFASADEAEKAKELIANASEERGGDAFLVDGFKVRVDFATSYDNSRGSTRNQFGGDRRGDRDGGDRRSQQQNLPSPQLFIGNIPYNVPAAEVSSQLSQAFPSVVFEDVGVPPYNPEMHTELPEDAQHRGFAFVRLSNADQATQVLESIKEKIESGEKVLGANNLRVEFKSERQRRPEGGGFGGDRFRSGGGGGGQRYGGRGEEGGFRRGGNDRGGRSSYQSRGGSRGDSDNYSRGRRYQRDNQGYGEEF